jgi:hypothetical protein
MSAECWKVGSLVQGNVGTYYEGWLGLIVKEEDGYFYFHWLIFPPGAYVRCRGAAPAWPRCAASWPQALPLFSPV